MRVGINAIFLEPGMGGVGTYVRELVPAVLAAAPRRLDLTLLCNERGRDMLAPEPWADDVRLEVPAIITKRGLRAAGELTVLGRMASARFDVLHSTAMTGPLATRAANVVVVHDVTWLTAPDLSRDSAPTVRLWQAIIPRVARRADRVIADTYAVAREIEHHLRVPAERIDVVPLGFRASARTVPTPPADLRARFGLGDGPLVLDVAMKKVHKNLSRLVAAMPAVREAVPGAQLVLPGAPTPYEQQLREQAVALGIGAAVAFPGYVSDADLEGFYALADAFVFPSLSEGFGLPVLEAMARGVPVVTSNRSSMPEVAGDAAVLVDPASVQAIADATIAVLNDPALRTRLIEAGRARPAAFTWERTAAGTLASWNRARA